MAQCRISFSKFAADPPAGWLQRDQKFVFQEKHQIVPAL